MIQPEEFFANLTKNNPSFDVDFVKLAFEFAKKAHEGQKRLTGEDYVYHPLAVANKLSSMRLDQPTVIAGLLHDVPEDTPVTLEEVKKEFGEEIAQLVNGVTKLGKLKYRGMHRYAENLRKMFVAMAEDVRVVFIKFADRIENLKTLSPLPSVKQKRIATETLEIYAPIAHRLSLGELKDEMEDLAFLNLLPQEYQQTKNTLDERIPQSKKNVENAIRQLSAELQRLSIPYQKIYGRTKRVFSLFNKLKKYNNDIDRIFDLIALRVLTSTVGECYQVLGVVHSIWKPLPNRIKDFIANPKPNGYQSIHTTVFLPTSSPIECQIRTTAMHEQAEYGIAAHFAYKDTGNANDRQIKKLQKSQMEWIEKLKAWQTELEDNEQFIKEMKLDIFRKRIFVFTPRGDAIDLPEDATPIDFAYHIHTDIGHKCSGVYINQELKSLTTPLKSGDVVEILVDKHKKGPSEDWLTIVKTHMARDHVKQFFHRQRKGMLAKLFSKKG